MKIIKKILLVIAGIVALILVVALFMKNEYAVQQEIVINKPKQDVFNYIKIISNQKHYNKWVMTDPNLQRETRGTDGTVGFVVSWNSKMDEVGEGEQEIISVKEGERIDFALRFKRPFEGKANSSMVTEAVNDHQTKIIWTFSGVSKYPMNIMNPMVGNMLGKDLATSFSNLKKELEK